MQNPTYNQNFILQTIPLKYTTSKVIYDNIEEVLTTNAYSGAHFMADYILPHPSNQFIHDFVTAMILQTIEKIQHAHPVTIYKAQLLAFGAKDRDELAFILDQDEAFNLASHEIEENVMELIQYLHDWILLEPHGSLMQYMNAFELPALYMPLLEAAMNAVEAIPLSDLENQKEKARQALSEETD